MKVVFQSKKTSCKFCYLMLFQFVQKCSDVNESMIDSDPPQFSLTGSRDIATTDDPQEAANRLRYILEEENGAEKYPSEENREGWEWDSSDKFCCGITMTVTAPDGQRGHFILG